MWIFVAGQGSKTCEQAVQRLGMGKLYSALNEARLIAKYPVNHRLLIDSGAHSWNKTSINVVGGHARSELPPIKDYLDKYLKICALCDTSSRILVELDCYAHLRMEELDEAWQHITSRLTKATYIRVYHTRLDGGTLRVFKKWLAQGQSYVGLGLDSAPVWPEIFAMTKNEVRCHGFAATREDLLLKYPFYSVDSSTAIAGARYGGGFVKKSRNDFAAAAYFGRDKAKKERRVGAVAKHYSDSITEGVEATKRLQDKITEVWKQRGIEWKD